MNRRTWKQGENRVASYFGSTRTPLSGGNSKITCSDSLHPTIFIETKHSKRPPAYNLWQKTKALAKAEGKTPLLVFIPKGSPNPFVICSLHDLKKIAQEVQGDQEAAA